MLLFHVRVCLRFGLFICYYCATGNGELTNSPRPPLLRALFNHRMQSSSRWPAVLLVGCDVYVISSSLGGAFAKTLVLTLAQLLAYLLSPFLFPSSLHSPSLPPQTLIPFPSVRCRYMLYGESVPSSLCLYLHVASTTIPPYLTFIHCLHTQHENSPMIHIHTYTRPLAIG